MIFFNGTCSVNTATVGSVGKFNQRINTDRGSLKNVGLFKSTRVTKSNDAPLNSKYILIISKVKLFLGILLMTIFKLKNI